MKGIPHVHVDVRTLLMRLRALFTAREPQSWDRVSLCSMAPLSADAFRHNEEAEHSHGHWY